MQINTLVQSPDYVSPVEKNAGKPELQIKNDFDSANLSNSDSQKFEELTKALEENSISLNFSQDDDTKALVVKLVDKTTGEEIRQMPTEVSLKLVAINAKIRGNFVDEKS